MDVLTGANSASALPLAQLSAESNHDNMGSINSSSILVFLKISVWSCPIIKGNEPRLQNKLTQWFLQINSWQPNKKNGNVVHLLF